MLTESRSATIRNVTFSISPSEITELEALADPAAIIERHLAEARRPPPR